MQLSEKEKQALQEKIKEQRQAMWSGKQAASQDAEEKAADGDQNVNPSGEPAEPPAGSDESIPSDVQTDSSSTASDPPAPTETTDEKTISSQSSVQPEVDSEGKASASDSTRNNDDSQKTFQSLDGTAASSLEPEATPVAGNTDAPEEDQQATQGERVFWETLEQEGGTSSLTWKIVVAVIGVALVLVGVGIYLGFLFAG